MGDPAERLMTVIPAAHLLAALLSVAWAWFFARKPSPWPSAAGCAAALAASALLVVETGQAASGSVGPVALMNWASLGGVFPAEVPIELQASRLSAVLLAAINAVALGVLLPGTFRRPTESAWFAPLASLQLFATGMLILSPNLLAFLLFWELIGVAGYLLGAAESDATGKAESTRRVALVWLMADVALALGVFLIWLALGTLDSAVMFGEGERLADVLERNPALITVICFCLLAAAAGRCAQFPLLGWLNESTGARSDILLQSATLMPAGVYLLVFSHPLFGHAPQACLIMSVLGALTALLAGWIAISQNDVYRVLGYSTASHVGLMLAALGTGTTLGLDAAVFHLSSHSLVKAALFVAATMLLMPSNSGHGNRQRPFAAGAFLVAALLLCSGLLGQNAILTSIREAATPVVDSSDVATTSTLPAIADWLCSLAVVVQALSLLRALFSIVAGRAEVSASMDSSPSPAFDKAVAALLLLGGIVGVPLAFYRSPLGGLALLAPDAETAGFNLAIVLLAAVCMRMFYARPRELPATLSRSIEPFARLGRDRFHLDEILSLAVARPVRGLAWFCRFAEWLLFDKAAGLVAAQFPELIAHAARPLRNETAQFYALSLLIATTSLLAVLLWFQG